MTAPVFQSDGTLAGCPATELAAGDCAVWRMPSNSACLSALDAVTGITRPPAGAVRWFGCDISALSTQQVLATLRRVAPLVPDGGLVGNIRMIENILLPCEARGGLETGPDALRGVLASAPWSGWFSEAKLWVLPYEAGELERALSGVLRAWLVRPEAIVVCNASHLLESNERGIFEAALLWLRTEQPASAWLFIQTESALPAGFGRNTLEAES